MRKTDPEIILSSPSSWSDLITTKRRRDRKNIPWWRHHLRLDVIVRKERSPSRHAGEVADTVVVIVILNRAAMEKTISPFSFAFARDEEEISPQYQEIW
jgi:hypothetical protein